MKSGLGYFVQKYSRDMGLRVGPSFLLNPTRNASPTPHLHKVWPYTRCPCHTWNLGPETPCEEVSPNFHVSQWLRLHRLISSGLKLRTWNPMWTGPWCETGVNDVWTSRQVNIFGFSQHARSYWTIVFIEFSVHPIFCAVNANIPRVLIVDAAGYGNKDGWSRVSENRELDESGPWRCRHGHSIC